MDTGQWVVVLLSVIIGGWYIGGYLINRKLTRATVRWLHNGLQIMDGALKVEKLGTFAPGAKLLVPKAVKPFKRFEAAFILESRENLPFWIYYRLRGKKDELLLKGVLKQTPGIEVELARAGDRTFESWILEPDNQHLSEASAPEGFSIYIRGLKGNQLLDDLQSLLRDYGKGITRLSIRSTSPHVSAKADLIPLLGASPEQFFRDLKGLIETRG